MKSPIATVKDTFGDKQKLVAAVEKFTGEDPCDVPMKIFPAVHYSMGGLWVDYERTADGFLVPPIGA